MKVKPIFIFSVPRSGSTLLYRILVSHSKITGLPETWILLPFIYSFKEKGVLSEYSHITSYTAINEFIEKLPNKKFDFFQELRNFVINLYQKQCKKNEQYYLDKTPRYYYIIREIGLLFPEAKFIFLFRNPIQIYSSVIETWSNGRLKKLYPFYDDLYRGIPLLIEGYKFLKEKAIKLRYEDLVTNPEFYVRRICNYLEIDFSENMISDIKIPSKSKLGDKTGLNKYKNKLSKEPIEKWKFTFNTFFRKNLIKKYISYIGSDRLELMGYSPDTLLKDIDNLKINFWDKRNFTDPFDYSFSTFVRYCNCNIFFGKKIGKWAKRIYLR